MESRQLGGGNTNLKPGYERKGVIGSIYLGYLLWSELNYVRCCLSSPRTGKP